MVVEWIPDDAFETCLRFAPQVTVELVVVNDGGVLLAQRTNQPARGEWFWPGGRLRKGEELPAAIDRVAATELGLDVRVLEELGAAEHHWDVSSVEGVESRHTVSIVYAVEPAGEFSVTLDDQHDEWRILRDREDNLHEYVTAYLDRWDLLDGDE